MAGPDAGRAGRAHRAARGRPPGLMAFLLAITMGMATDRFDARRGIVLAEANAIGNAYLQADYLPTRGRPDEGAAAGYLPLRIATADRTQVLAQHRPRRRPPGEMWAIAAECRPEPGHSPDLVSPFGESLTEYHQPRSRRESWASLLQPGARDDPGHPAGRLGAVALGMVGYGAGLTGQRSVLSARSATTVRAGRGRRRAGRR